VSSPQLVAIVDGQRLAPDDARAIWQRFSVHMDENEGDFDGFAATEGFRYARVSVQDHTPSLVVTNEPAPLPDTKAANTRGKKKRGRRKKKPPGSR
jgi:hypothetical protein